MWTGASPVDTATDRGRSRERVDGVQVFTRPTRHGGWWRRLVAVVVTTTALAAVGALAATPAAALPVSGGTVNAGSFAVSGGGIVEDPGPPGTSNTIAVTGPRTILEFSSFNLAAGHQLNIVVTSASDIVLIRVASGAVAQVAGFLNVTTGLPVFPTGTLGEAPTNPGGHVWFSAGTGVSFAGTARVRTGGLLATTANLVNDADFLGSVGNLAFSGGSGGIVQDAGSVISGHGGHVALVADSVSQAGTIEDPGNNTDVLLAGAQSFTLGLGQEPAGGHALLGFSVAPPDAFAGGFPGGQSTSLTPLSVSGSVTGANVYLLSDSSDANAVGPIMYTPVNATGHVADSNGSLLVVSGGGMSRTGLASPPRATQRSGAAPQPIPVSVSIGGSYQTVLAASGDLTIDPGAVLSGQQVVLSTGDDLSYAAGSISPPRWVIYAPTPADVPNPGLNSGRTAFWNGTITANPPSTVIDTSFASTDRRYVFAWAPDVTVTALDTSKIFDVAFAAGQPHTLQATVSGPPHPGVPGLFTADPLPTFTGAPSLSSEGQSHTAPERPASVGGPYPIVVGAGNLFSPLRYDFVLNNGTLTVDDQTPPTVTPTLTGTTPGDNGWHRSDVTLTWAVTDIGTHPAGITRGPGCATQTFTSDVDTSVTCVGTSLGGETTVTEAVKRDASAPTLDIDGLLPGGSEYTAGTWTNQAVEVFYTCGFDISGPAAMNAMPVSRSGAGAVTTTGDYGATCRDAAGNTTTQPFQVNIDKVAPTVGNEELRTADGVLHTAGTWTNQDVQLTWTCADTGGSGVAASGSATATSPGTLQALCRDGAGNEGEGDSFAVSIDKIGPTGSLTMTKSDGTPYIPGTWSRLPVTVTVTCGDTGGSGAGTGPFSATYTATGSATFFCSDNAGNTTPVPTGTIQIDGAAPAIGDVTLTTADGEEYTSGDWASQAVTLSWTCTDAADGSGADSATGSDTATSTGPLRASCTDLAGNSTQGELFQANIDTTDPVLSGVPANQSLTTTGSSATATWTAPTATDDVDTTVDVACDPPSGSSFPIGPTTVTCIATDHAGNTDTETFTVTVTRQAITATAVFDKPIDSAPVLNIAKLGRAVPVKATVTSGGTPVTGPSALPVHLGVSSGIDCDIASTADTIENYAVGSANAGNLMRWDATAQRWSFLLDTGAFAMKPNGCYRVSVYYGGSVSGDRATGGTLAGYFFIQTKK